jgi:hypothetical protein
MDRAVRPRLPEALVEGEQHARATMRFHVKLVIEGDVDGSGMGPQQSR